MTRSNPGRRAVGLRRWAERRTDGRTGASIRRWPGGATACDSLRRETRARAHPHTDAHTPSFRLKKTRPRGDTLNTQELPPILQTPVRGRRCTWSHAGWFQSSCAQGEVCPPEPRSPPARVRVLLSPLPVQGPLDTPASASAERKSSSRSLGKHLCSSRTGGVRGVFGATASGATQTDPVHRTHGALSARGSWTAVSQMWSATFSPAK